MSWKDLSELAPQLTEGEVRFERGKRLIGFFLGPLSFLLILLFAPPLPEVTPVGMRSLAVFSWIIIWWITEAIPIPATAILSLPLIAVCGIWPYQRAFSYWSHWVVMFTIGAFVIGHGMQLHGLTRRFGLALIGSRLVAGKPWRLLVFYLIATAVASAFLSNVATTVLFLSMGIGLLEILKIKPGSQYGLALFLGIAWVANIGGMLTPGGTPTNLIAIGLSDQLMNYRMGYVQWFLGALPFVALQMAVMFGILRYFLPRKEIQYPISAESVHEELRRLGPFSRGEKYATAALIAAVILWAMPDLVPIWLGGTHPASVWLRERLNWGVAAMLVASSLFVMPLDWQKRKFAMTWSEAARNIEWGTAALVASALAVGEMIGDREVGLGNFFAYGVGRFRGTGVVPLSISFGNDYHHGSADQSGHYGGGHQLHGPHCLDCCAGPRSEPHCPDRDHFFFEHARLRLPHGQSSLRDGFRQRTRAHCSHVPARVAVGSHRHCSVVVRGLFAGRSNLSLATGGSLGFSRFLLEIFSQEMGKQAEDFSNYQ